MEQGTRLVLVSEVSVVLVARAANNLSSVAISSSRSESNGIGFVQQPDSVFPEPSKDIAGGTCPSSDARRSRNLTGAQQSETLQDEALLRYYAQEWDRYTTGANYINRLFTYLNWHWVKRERDEGRKGIYPVYTVRSENISYHFSDSYTIARPSTMEDKLLRTYTKQTPETCGCHFTPYRATKERRDH